MERKSRVVSANEPITAEIDVDELLALLHENAESTLRRLVARGYLNARARRWLRTQRTRH